MIEDMISYRKANSDVVAERCAVVFGVAGDLGSVSHGTRAKEKETHFKHFALCKSC